MKPIIGIFSAFDGERSYLSTCYTRAVEESGGVPVMLPIINNEESIDAFINMCDGFIFAGGEDVEPRRYGAVPSENLGKTVPERDEVEFSAFAKIIKTDKPVMGICRGSQLINAALGGTLYQDLPTEFVSEVAHQSASSTSSPTHMISIVKDTPLAKLAASQTAEINTFHHQAIRDLAEGLLVMARADDGIIEASYMPSKRYLMLFQWHPEKLFDTSELNKKIFKDFIRHATE